MNLEEIEKRLIEIESRCRADWQPTDHGTESSLVSICRDLIAEVERLKGLDELHQKTGTPAQHVVQLNEMYRERTERLQREKADLEQLREAMVKQATQQEQEIEELGVALCAMRGALIEVAEDDDPRDGCAHADRAKQALSSAAPTCPHKEEAEKLRQEWLQMRFGKPSRD